MEERRDDWRHGVDENLASLNTGQRVHDRLLEDLDANYAALDRLLRGDTEHDTDGLIAKMHILETQIARLNAVIFMDAAGKHGMQHEVKELMEGREDRRLGWKNITKIIVALIMAGLLGRFYGDLIAYVSRKAKPSIEHKHKHKTPAPPEDDGPE